MLPKCSQMIHDLFSEVHSVVSCDVGFRIYSNQDLIRLPNTSRYAPYHCKYLLLTFYPSCHSAVSTYVRRQTILKMRTPPSFLCSDTDTGSVARRITKVSRIEVLKTQASKSKIGSIDPKSLIFLNCFRCLESCTYAQLLL